MFDLAQLDTTKAAEEGATLEVRHPATGAVLPGVTITLAGADSERARKAERAVLNRRLKMGGRRGTTITAEEIDNDALDALAACTLGWSGFVIEGQELECNPANARRLYQQYPWLREQAEEFRSERANFLRASPTS